MDNLSVRTHLIVLIFSICVCFIFSPMAFCKIGSSGSHRSFVSIGTASVNGVYYQLGAFLCSSINSSQKTNGTLICSSSATSGSMYNLNALRSGMFDVAAVQPNLAYYAYKGIDYYKNLVPMQNLRIIGGLHKEFLTIVVRKNSNIKTLDDITGKRINIGAPGTGTRSMIDSMMKGKRWTKDDFISTSKLTPSEEAEALCDDKIDVMIEVTGHPNSAIHEASISCGVKIIPLSFADISSILSHSSYGFAEELPRGIYVGEPGGELTVCMQSVMLATTNLPESTAYNLSKTLVNGIDKLRSLNSSYTNVGKCDIATTKLAKAIPMHPGSIKYYSEQHITMDGIMCMSR